MPSPRKGETKQGRSSGEIFIYKDPKTGEIYNYVRRGIYKKNGRFLIFVKRSRGEIMSEHILNKTARTLADEKAGYPPNCNDVYVAKDGKCVPVEGDSAEWKKDKKKKKDGEDKNGDEEKNGNPFDKKKK